MWRRQLLPRACFLSTVLRTGGAVGRRPPQLFSSVLSKSYRLFESLLAIHLLLARSPPRNPASSPHGQLRCVHERRHQNLHPRVATERTATTKLGTKRDLPKKHVLAKKKKTSTIICLPPTTLHVSLGSPQTHPLTSPPPPPLPNRHSTTSVSTSLISFRSRHGGVSLHTLAREPFLVFTRALSPCHEAYRMYCYFSPRSPLGGRA